MPLRPFSVCVYCGARDGNDPAFGAAAEAMGTMLAANTWRLIYGAGDVGLMGRVARAAQAKGGETFGVIPEHLVEWEVGKSDLTSFIITETMHERKKVMLMNADTVVVMPGGAGSLDEMFEVLTWRQLGLHEKPVFLLNINNYWGPLLDMVDHIIENGFADPSLRSYLTVVDDVETLHQELANHLEETQQQ